MINFIIYYFHNQQAWKCKWIFWPYIQHCPKNFFPWKNYINEWLSGFECRISSCMCRAMFIRFSKFDTFRTTSSMNTKNRNFEYSSIIFLINVEWDCFLCIMAWTHLYFCLMADQMLSLDMRSHDLSCNNFRSWNDTSV